MDREAHMSYGRFQPVGAEARRRVCALLAGSVLLLAATRSPAVAAPAATQAPTGAIQAEPSLRQDATFTHITIEQGLSDQRIKAIVQDRAGFIWIGTDNGLNRYDGHRVVAYLNDPTNPHLEFPKENGRRVKSAWPPRTPGDSCNRGWSGGGRGCRTSR